MESIILCTLCHIITVMMEQTLNTKLFGSAELEVMKLFEPITVDFYINITINAHTNISHLG